MATDTSTQYLSVVHCTWRYRRPGRRKFFMTGFTKICGVKMCRSLTTSRHTIMATHAVINKRRMIYRRGNPCADLVANITFFLSWNMTDCFSCRSDVIMATGTATDNFIVIHYRGSNRYPGTGDMAGFT